MANKNQSCGCEKSVCKCNNASVPCTCGAGCSCESRCNCGPSCSCNKEKSAR